MLDRKAATEVTLVLAFIGVVNLVTYQVTWVYAGPITAALTIVLCTFLIRRSGSSWRDFGLGRPTGPLRMAWQGLLALSGSLLVLYIASHVVGLYFQKPETIASRFGEMEGNLGLYLWWVMLGWVFGGFGKEMIFRGYLLNRFEAALGGKWHSTVIAILLQAAVFGIVHYYYQGAYGALTLFAITVFFGFCYLAFGRTLWPLILAHGTMNTLGFLGEYLGDKAI